MDERRKVKLHITRKCAVGPHVFESTLCFRLLQLFKAALQKENLSNPKGSPVAAKAAPTRRSPSPRPATKRAWGIETLANMRRQNEHNNSSSHSPSRERPGSPPARQAARETLAKLRAQRSNAAAESASPGVRAVAEEVKAAAKGKAFRAPGKALLGRGRSTMRDTVPHRTILTLDCSQGP